MRLQINCLIAALGLIFLSSCSRLAVVQDDPSAKYEVPLALEKLTEWRFTGRLAVTTAKNSWSAGIDWQHTQGGGEAVKLSGPLGQGAVQVVLTDYYVSIDRGNGKVETSTQVQDLINRELGLIVPLRALRYWVLGMPEPRERFVKFGKGFNQLGWLVEYERTQSVSNIQLPQKITVLNQQAKLKLIIDGWDLENGKTR